MLHVKCAELKHPEVTKLTVKLFSQLSNQSDQVPQRHGETDRRQTDDLPRQYRSLRSIAR